MTDQIVKIVRVSVGYQVPAGARFSDKKLKHLLTSMKIDSTIKVQLNMHSMFSRKGAKREAGENPARSRHCGMVSMLYEDPLVYEPGRNKVMR